ncbi:MAG: hypothetical protein L6262_00690 [Weeksellaceae bacterium]|nr:hypothetical protein [Weeksellaceae bacterium]
MKSKIHELRLQKHLSVSKNIFFFAWAIVCSSATISAQSKAPKEVVTAFYSKFPKATKVKWDKENATEYESSFTENNVKHSANYSSKGEWLETESPTIFVQLPWKQKTETK